MMVIGSCDVQARKNYVLQASCTPIPCFAITLYFSSGLSANNAAIIC